MPDKIKIDPLDTVTITGVELMTAGTHDCMTGRKEVTSAHLKAAVDAVKDPAVRLANLKLGHIGMKFGDAMPSLGWVSNLRLSDNGMTLLGDYVSVPRAFAPFIVADEEGNPPPYPFRSVEMVFNTVSGSGTKHDCVLKAVSLLGEKEAAVDGLEISSLDDVLTSYLAAAKGDEDIPGETLALFAATTSDTIRSSYREKYPNNPQTEDYRWVREVWIDEPASGFLIVEDEPEGDLYRVEWTLTSSGDVEFADPVKVDIVYEEVTAASKGPKLLHRDFPQSTGEAAIVSASKAQTNPGGVVDPKELRKQLGLAEDATDEAVNAAFTEFKEKAEKVPSLEQKLAEMTADPGTTQTPPTVQLPEGVVPITQEALAELQAKAEAGNTAREEQVAAAKAKVLDDAQEAHKFGVGEPAKERREAFSALLDTDFEGTKALIDKMPPLVKTATSLRGHEEVVEAGKGELPDDLAALDAAVFPEDYEKENA